MSSFSLPFILSSPGCSLGLSLAASGESTDLTSGHEVSCGRLGSGLPRPARANPQAARATVNQECITAYNDLKLNKRYKYVIFKLSDDSKEIVVDSTSEDGPEYEDFREKLINAKTKSKTGAVGKGPRYAVYDFEYQLSSGEGVRNKITFIAWSPDDAGVMAKMIYASSKEALKRALPGLATEVQANDADDIEYDTLIKTVSKGTAA
ncbi:hypothetical protein N656DRAFT_765993 [Canariomyces notabilis]|uniref:Cofilin n=1 Tax=Canariomyces notabilis TaxID=2074819 RepID=A0AAN6TJK6_9PEZI|nr:hypothetical protein N656DRAFT_765993 [Canariomyces arenarius]